MVISLIEPSNDTNITVPNPAADSPHKNAGTTRTLAR